MDFNYTEDQQAFADSARALFADACSDEALRAHDAGDEPFMQALWRQCIATGLHGMNGHALAAEQFGDHRRQLGIVVNDQDQRFGTHAAAV